ncbi:MAG TPA: signal peptidase I [Pirellulales bacterium]|jgi:signal peptidase I|nr:signal peptidase I [Pirellulales bacterium]
MAKKPNFVQKHVPSPEPRERAKSASERPAPFSSRAIRETVEAIAVAFVLAFLFRTFEAEAFVIPTGSMAPTLLGQNKDLFCPKCGYHYQAGASSEDEQLAEQRGIVGGARDVVAVTCPLCRYEANVDPHTAVGRDYPSYGGDRILVSKFTYDFSEPRRWDIAVFKYPGGAQTNYIKRVVGLPGETIRLWHGDVFLRAPGEDAETPFARLRREPVKLRAMAQIVYDNDYVVDEMTQRGWPLRWQAWPEAADSQATWSSNDGGRSFQAEAGNLGERWLRYQHFTPSTFDWDALRTGTISPDRARPRLITDFYAYDTSVARGDRDDQPQMLGLNWVGDLMLEFELRVVDANGAALLDLVKGGRHFRCEIDCTNGKAQLAIDGLDDFHPSAQTAIRGTGTHRVIFANIDEQLVLWVDGAPVDFDSPTAYAPLGNDKPSWTAEDPLDLAPAGIGARGGALAANHIRLWRDLYYIAARDGALVDYISSSPIIHLDYANLLRFWSSPELWSPAGRASPFDSRREAVFPLAADQFFVLGDNSPASADARLWSNEKFVPRDLLLGKALFIFWPHSFNKIPGTNIPFPFFPNFARMGFIR